jgi:hypothetical protein
MINYVGSGYVSVKFILYSVYFTKLLGTGI